MEPQNNCARQEGITLIESIICMIIVVILSGLAYPGMRSVIDRSAIRAERQLLVGDIRLVRRFALTRHRPAYLCGIDEQGKCSGKADWTLGWVGFVDKNYSHSIDPKDEVVFVRYRDKPGAVNIILHARWKRLKFNSSGILRSSGHFRVCLPGMGMIQSQKVIRMNAYGRLAVEDDNLECA